MNFYLLFLDYYLFTLPIRSYILSFYLYPLPLLKIYYKFHYTFIHQLQRILILSKRAPRDLYLAEARQGNSRPMTRKGPLSGLSLRPDPELVVVGSSTLFLSFSPSCFFFRAYIPRPLNFASLLGFALDARARSPLIFSIPPRTPLSQPTPKPRRI